VGTWESAGKVARAGCGARAERAERGVSAPSLFAWKKRLNQSAAEQFVAVQIVGTGEPASHRAIEVRLCGGRSVMVEPGFDAAHLRAVLDVLDMRA
jgi:hypothetical protein